MAYQRPKGYGKTKRRLVRVAKVAERVRRFVGEGGIEAKVEIVHVWAERKSGRERAMIWVNGVPILAYEEDC
jgi:hypothetical protein